MPEIEKPVKTLQISYSCDVCGQGEMRPTGGALMSNPPLFPHKCTNCSETKTFYAKYPAFVYKTEE